MKYTGEVAFLFFLILFFFLLRIFMPLIFEGFIYRSAMRGGTWKKIFTAGYLVGYGLFSYVSYR